MAVDPWPKTASPTGFGRKGLAITPNNTTDLDPIPKAINVTGAGTLAIVPVGNGDAEIITYTSVSPGFMPPYIVRRVMATGTTATVASIDG